MVPVYRRQIDSKCYCYKKCRALKRKAGLSGDTCMAQWTLETRRATSSSRRIDRWDAIINTGQKKSLECFSVAQRYAGSPVTLLGITSNARQQTRGRDYDEVITRNTLLSPDTGIEEAFKHRSIDLGARALARTFVFAPLFVSIANSLPIAF